MAKTDQLKTFDYITLIRNHLISNGESGSDYNIAKKLGITQSCISRYVNHRGTMDDRTCVNVARYLHLDPMKVIAAVHAERALSKEDKQFWEDVFKKLPTKVATLAAIALAPLMELGHQLCILCKIKDSSFCR